MNKVINGDYKGKGVMRSWPYVVITLPLFRTVKISSETVVKCQIYDGINWIDIKYFDCSRMRRRQYTIIVAFYDGKCSTLQVNKTICRAIKKAVSSGAEMNKKRTDAITIFNVPIRSAVPLFIFLLFDVQFIRMFPQGYADIQYWILFFVFLCGTCYLAASLCANVYMEKHKWDVVTLNQMMNESYDLEDYFKNRDELISYLSKMAKTEFLLKNGNRLTEKPSILLQKLEENESKSVRSAILRMTAHYKRLVREKKHEFSELFSDALRDYSHRLNKENIQEMELCLKILKDYERVCGKIEETDGMDGHDFEYWCAELLKKNGFTEVEVTKGSGDQGVDVLAVKDGIRYAIQCKCYSSNLGNGPVQEVHAGKALYHCQVGVVMTNRHFTPGAKELATATGVLLWDRDKLEEMLTAAP